jgi:subtilisin family serine protease
VRNADGFEVVGGEALVKFRDTPTANRVRGPLAAFVDSSDSVPVNRAGLHLFRSRTFPVDALIAFLQTQPDVEFASPNFVYRTTAVPDDPSFPSLWGLLNSGQLIAGTFGTPDADIDATDAWDESTGSTSHVVAVIDTGIDYNHVDLAANMWSAPAPFEVTINGLTINCAAGTHGFNAINHTCNPMDDQYHGTHVAGTIGAVGNNGIGVTGVNWTTRLIGGKFLNSGGSGTTVDAVEAIEFMIQAKAAFAATSGANIRVLNNSWGGGGFDAALASEIALANSNNMLFVAAAGNAGNNNDVFPFYPASYNIANVLAVASTTNQDFKSGFSNYGAATVPLAAPGSNVYSTMPGNSYAFLSGTSMASPHVAGAAALVLSECALDTADLKDALISSVDVLGSLSGLVTSSGRLNVDRALNCGAPSAPGAPTQLTAIGFDSQINLTWTAPAGATSYKVKRSTTNGGPYSVIASGVPSPSYVDTDVINGITYYYVVSAVNAVGESGNSLQASATPVGSVPVRPTGLKATPGDALVNLVWVASPGTDHYNVQRSPTGANPWVTIATPAAAAYTDTAVTNGLLYYYRVNAENEAGASAFSAKVKATPAPVPAPPTGFIASPGASPGTANLSWNASAFATAYKVKRSLVIGGPYSNRKQVKVLNHVDTGISGKTYYYVITALNASGESGPSVQRTVVMP